MAQAASRLGETFDRVIPAGLEGDAVIGKTPARENDVDAFLVSTGIVALAEMGDKTGIYW